MTSTPPPDDKVLSPLVDPRLTQLELRGRLDAKNGEVVLGRARFDRAELAAGAAPMLSLGPVPVFEEKRDLQLVALGAGGQQVLGLAIARDTEVRYGETHEYVFDVRRPLFFFGSGRKLVPPVPFSEMDKPLSPGRRIAAGLEQEHLLRVVDPNSGTPLLSAYHLALDGTRQALSSAATSDGLSVLAVSEGGTLHVIETLRLKAALSVKLPTDMPAQHMAVSGRDDSAAILHYEIPSPAVGTVGRITFVRDLPGLRSRVSKDGDPLSIEVKSELGAPLGPPLHAAYGPDGLLDVVFGRAPLTGGEPNCGQLSGAAKAVLRRYDPKTGQVKHQSPIAYSTSLSYNEAGEQLLVQPCVQAMGGKRPGQVLFQKWQGDAFVPLRVLAAPGSADVGVVGQTVVAVGRDDVVEASDGTTKARGVVRVLEPGLSTWSPQSPFSLDDWLLPYRVTIGDKDPLPASVEIVLAPRDLLVYRVVATPDRSRALVTARVTHEVEGMFLNRITANGRDYICYIDWLGYTYHVMLVNLQTGAREQGWLVGVQNQSCDSMLYDTVDKRVVGTCFAECQYTEGGITKNGRLRGYQEGFIPTGTSALFSGQ